MLCLCVQATEDQIRLLKHQKMLEEKLGSKFIGLPLSDTMYQVLLRHVDSVNGLAQ